MSFYEEGGAQSSTTGTNALLTTLVVIVADREGRLKQYARRYKRQWISFKSE